MRCMARKTMLLLFAMVLFTAGPAAVAAAQATKPDAPPPKVSLQDVKQQMAEALQALGSYGADQRDQAVETAGTALQAADARIEQMARKLQSKWHRMNKTARQQAARSLRGVYEERNKVSEWYGGLKHGSADAWDEMKTGFVESYEELLEGIGKVGKEY